MTMEHGIHVHTRKTLMVIARRYAIAMLTKRMSVQWTSDKMLVIDQHFLRLG